MTDDAKKPGRKGFGVNFKVSAKGAVSVYGLGRFPVTLYREQWVRLLERSNDLKAFMEEHAAELAKKGEAPAAGEQAAAAGQPANEQPGGEQPSLGPAETALGAPSGGEERPAEQTAEGASAPATTVDEAGADLNEGADADVPPDDYDGVS